jgi:CubicO group peptidase (beta-lactamase class C family)
MTLPLLAAPRRPHHRGTKPLRGYLRALAILLGAACLVAYPSFLVRASAEPDPDLASIDAYVEKEMRDVRIPGLALGIVHNDEVVHIRGFGEAGPDGRTVTPQTPFILASVSKSFTALAVMQLVEAGKVDLDAPVRRYLPDFRVSDEVASARITVRHLLHHISGLPEDSSFGPMLSNDISDEALSDRVRALEDVQLSHGVGEVFEYTDPNYDVLGLVVQTISGQSYESYIAEHVFAPLGMSHSYTNQVDARRNGLATGHRSWFGYPRPFQAPYSRAAMPSSYLISSAEDITHFLSMQLNGGSYQGTSLLSPEGIAAMHEPAVREGTRDIFYGMGWESRSVSGVPVVCHDGTNPNFYADLVLDPEDRWGVVILTNFDSLNLNGGRLQNLSSGVISLLHGAAPAEVPTPHHPLLAPATLLVAVVTVLMLVGIVRTVVLLRRWRIRPESRLRGPWAMALRVGLPLSANVGWGLGLLLSFPQVAYPLMPTMLLVPDLGYLVVASGLAALTWGILRTALVYSALRRRDKSKPAQSSVPATAVAVKNLMRGHHGADVGAN